MTHVLGDIKKGSVKMWSYRIYSGGGGGPVIIPPEAGNLTSIIVSKMPKKIDYMVGESLNIDGLEVKAIFDNDVTAVVTSACTLTVNNPLTANDTSIKVSYEGFETNFNINVYSENLEIPTGTIYLLHLDGNLDNEITDSTGTITTYQTTKYASNKIGQGLVSGGSDDRLIISNDVNIPSVSELAAGATLTVQFWYKNTHTTDSTLCNVFSIGDYIRLQCRSGNRYAFGGGTSFEGASFLDWVHIALVFSNSSVKFFTNGKLTYTYAITSNNDSRELRLYMRISGNTYLDEVLVSTEALYKSDFEVPTSPYAGKTVLDRLYIDTPPTKTTYAEGETFSLEGASIKAVFSTGIIMDVTSECTILEKGPLAVGDQYRTVSYTYEGITKTVYINVGVTDANGDPIPSQDSSGKYAWSKYSNYQGGIETPDNTKLLMHFDGNLIDETNSFIPSMYGVAKYDTGLFKQALKLDGTNSVNIPYSNNIKFGSNDFTIAGWFYWDGSKATSDVGTWPCLFSHTGYYNENYTKSGFIVQINTGTNCLAWQVYSYGYIRVIDESTSTTIPVNEWFHVALVRKGSSIMLFLNGKILSSKTIDTSSLYQHETFPFKIGATNDTNKTNSKPRDPFFGKIDEFIIVKDTALWDTNFTPPTAPYGNGLGTFEGYVVSDDENAYPDSDYADDEIYYIKV